MSVAVDDNGNRRRTPDGRPIYRCDCCEKLEPWNDNWAWFGSIKQFEDQGMKGVKPVLTICSAECRLRMVADGRLPHAGLTDSGNVDEEYAPPKSRRRA